MISSIKATLRLTLLLLAMLATAGQSFGLSPDSASFNPTTVQVTAQSTIAVGTVVAWPANSSPFDMTKWLECNGQAVPAGSQYDRLRTVLGGGAVPNYNNQFLRGTTTAGLVGTQVADTIRSHTVSVPGQNAPVSANLNSTGVSGSASPQSFSYQATNPSGAAVINSAPMATVGWENYNISNFTAGGSTSGGSISGSVNNSAVSGTAFVSAQTGTYAGGTETAPVHTRVRYLIRAIQ